MQGLVPVLQDLLKNLQVLGLHDPEELYVLAELVDRKRQRSLNPTSDSATSCVSTSHSPRWS